MGFSQLALLVCLPILLADYAVGFSCCSSNTITAGRRRKPILIQLQASEGDSDINNRSNENEDPISLDINILQQRMDRQQKQYAKLIMEQSRYIEQETKLPESVHIILFNPDTPNQNVHTLEIPKGSGNNMILAFEDGTDCGMFAQSLRELEFVDPSPSETMFEPFREFCESMSIPVIIVPAGFDLSPPQSNSKDRDDNDGEEEEDDGDVLASMSTFLEDDTDVTAVIIDDDTDSWG